MNADTVANMHAPNNARTLGPFIAWSAFPEGICPAIIEADMETVSLAAPEDCPDGFVFGPLYPGDSAIVYPPLGVDGPSDILTYSQRAEIASLARRVFPDAQEIASLDARVLPIYGRQVKALNRGQAAMLIEDLRYHAGEGERPEWASILPDGFGDGTS